MEIKNIEIGVSMNIETLLHKIELSMVGSSLIPYYEIARPGAYESFEELGTEIKKLWVANGGCWVGYFDVIRTNHNTLDLGQWHSLSKKLIPRKPFRGFTYKIPNGG